MTPSEILTEAKLQLEKRLWIRNTSAINFNGKKIFENLKQDAVGICCLFAFHITESTLDYSKDEVNMNTAKGFFKEAIQDNSIPNWNDYSCTSKQEALMAFDKAINLAKKDEERSSS